jgi:hypothetical protein
VKIYNLNPGTESFWKDIEVCEDLCPTFQNGLSLMLSKSLLFLIALALLIFK